MGFHEQSESDLKHRIVSGSQKVYKNNRLCKDRNSASLQPVSHTPGIPPTTVKVPLASPCSRHVVPDKGNATLSKVIKEIFSEVVPYL